MKKGFTDRFKDKITGNSGLTPEDQISIKKLISDIIRKTDHLVSLKPVSEMGYDVCYMQEILNCVKTMVNAYKSKVTKFELKKDFTVDLSLYVCHKAADTFIRLHQTYTDATDPHIYLEKKKPDYYKVFQQYCTGANYAAVLAGLICSKLREPILTRAYSETANDVYQAVKCTAPFKTNKCNLEKHILTSLASEMNFNKFMNFIQTPRDFYEKFIREQVETFMNNTTREGPKAIILLNTHIKQTAEFVVKAAAIATNYVKTYTGNTNTWLQKFSHEISTYLEKSCTDLVSAVNYQNTDFDLLVDIIQRELDDATVEMTEALSKQSELDMEMFRTKPHEILIEYFCDSCWEKCPFCSAVCVGSNKHAGNHYVPMHRFDGIDRWHYGNTEDFTLGFCTTLVSTNKTFLPSSEDKSVPYSDFRSAGGKYADWIINPDPSELAYWKWFICKFQTELETCYKKKFQGNGKIPHAWKQYTVDDAIRSLDKYG